MCKNMIITSKKRIWGFKKQNDLNSAFAAWIASFCKKLKKCVFLNKIFNHEKFIRLRYSG